MTFIGFAFHLEPRLAVLLSPALFKRRFSRSSCRARVSIVGSFIALSPLCSFKQRLFGKDPSLWHGPCSPSPWRKLVSSYTHVRGYPRLMVWLPVQLTLLSQGAHKVITGKTNSISPGGLGLLLSESIPLRTSVVVQVCLEEPLPGLVIWRDRPRPTGLGTSIPHGVAFDFLVDSDLIRQWVHHATPQSPSRVPVQFDVEFTQAGKAGHGTCLNLSRVGMFIGTKDPPRPGTEILLHFKLQESSHALSIPAQVVWMRGDGNWPGAFPGMGVKFLAVDPSKAALIGSVVDRLLGEASPSLDSS